VRVLAARFPDPQRASAALDTLHRRLDDGITAEIAPLAGDEGSATETLLAGHFPEDMKRSVRDIVEAAGGEIVADVDERWTRPRLRPGSASEATYRETERGRGPLVERGGGFGGFNN
jgi:hypothetical protein